LDIKNNSNRWQQVPCNLSPSPACHPLVSHHFSNHRHLDPTVTPGGCPMPSGDDVAFIHRAGFHSPAWCVWDPKWPGCARGPQNAKSKKVDGCEVLHKLIWR
jgi:hypothetical protein